MSTFLDRWEALCASSPILPEAFRLGSQEPSGFQAGVKFTDWGLCLDGYPFSVLAPATQPQER